MSSEKPNKIVVFGQGKTGTTALEYKIRNSLPSDTRLMHEPLAYTPLPDDNKHYVLAKVIAGIHRTDHTEIADYESFMGFDKKIYIVRDPRDTLVSLIIFSVSGIYGNEENLKRISDLLERKEKSPASVSLIEIIELFSTFMGKETFESLIDWMTKQYDWYIQFENRLDDYCISRYEEFVSGNTSAIEKYLGMDLPGAAQVGKGFEFLIRTKGYGDWKNWFTKEDIELFKPIFAAYMDKHGYTDQWEVNHPQIISPEHCTEYIKKTVLNKKRWDIEKAKRAGYVYRTKKLIRRILQIND